MEIKKDNCHDPLASVCKYTYMNTSSTYMHTYIHLCTSLLSLSVFIHRTGIKAYSSLTVADRINENR